MPDSGEELGSSECLTDATLALFGEGRLPPEDLARAREHAAGCAGCEALLLGVADWDAPDEDARAPHPPALPKAWTPPATFGVYRLGQELGRGAMGVVFHAYNISTRREVALKFIAAERPEPRLQDYFQNEVFILASFQHPNVLTVYTVGEVEGHPYIETEYVRGQSLAKLPRPLPWRRVLELGIGLSRGLAAAHRQGVLHRDIKPSNAVVTDQGEVKLLDFGLAERLAPGASAGSRGAAGTLLYMAPECADGAPATPRSDLYSLGVVLCQLCTDRVPEDDGRLGPGIDPDFAAIAERCIRSNPEERFASAELLREALEKLQARLPARVPSNPYRGLASFEAEHQALFFGRDADIRGVMERLGRQPLVLVTAESGIGKSSLCRAGILPRAATGLLADDRSLTTLIVSPGRRPLEALAAALAPPLSRGEAELFTALADEPERLGQQLRDLYREQGGLLLFVDQLEELVTLSDPAQAGAFARAIGQLALPSPAVRVLLAVRGDFFTRVTALPGLGDEAERALYLLRPMTPEGLREAIVGPARACGVSFESDALIRQLVDATAHGTGGLPLLSFALTELWERRDVPGARITQASLEALGGVPGLLSRHADGVVSRLSASQTKEARRMLVRLTTADRTRVECSEDELGVDSTDALVALRAMVEGRLLQLRTEGGQVRHRIAHDSLIQHWDLLRAWLDDDVGHRAIRQRLESASAEWVRMGRAQDALWPKRQLDETRPLDRSALGTRELEFIGASRARLMRRARLRRLATALAAVAVASPYGSFRLQQWLEERRFVSAQLEVVQEELDAARALGRDACARRLEALELFRPAGGASGDPGAATSRREAAETRWAKALAERERAGAAFSAAEESLQRALDRQYRHQDARQLLTDVSYGRLELAECFHPQGAGAEGIRSLLARFDDEPWRQRVETPAEVEIVTEPPGARVEIARYAASDEGGLREVPVPSPSSLTPIARLALPPGSYLFRIAGPARAPVALPVLLTRGMRERIRLALPASIPEGYAYIPPGCFLAGSDDPEVMRIELLLSSPLHRVCMEQGYVIGKTEITFGDWLKYLEALPPGASARRVLIPLRQLPAGEITLRPLPTGGWVLSFYRAGSRIFSAREGEEFRYPGRTKNASGDWRRLPLSGVSAEDLEGYFSWLDRSGRLRGARLCREDEWERAARGADARPYPGGHRLSLDDANFDATYGRQPDTYGPDVVGAHPASISPFGVLDMAGNALELTLPVTADLGRIVLRGGGWYYTRRNALVPNRGAGEPTMRSVVIGARACAPYPPPTLTTR